MLNAFLFSGLTPLEIKTLSLILFFSVSALFVRSQSTSLLIGARSQAMGTASSCLHDEWSFFNNIAGISSVNKTTVAVSYHAFPSFKTFNRMAATFLVPTSIGTIGAGAFRFGDNLYNEQLVSAGIGNTFGIASLGVRCNYIQFQAEGFGSKGVFTVSMGGIATLTPKVLVGAHITNVNQPEISGATKETIATKLQAGVAFKPSDKLFLTTELEKDLRYEAIIKAGLEYQFHKKFTMRTGFNLNPNAVFFGIGFKPGKLKLDYALGYDSVFGLLHQASVTYQIKK